MIDKFEDLTTRLKEAADEAIADGALRWSQLALYLQREYAEGKTEFRIAVNDDRTAVVHPLGKNGQTINIEI